MDKEILRKWLKAGYLERDVLFATTEGTTQGGIASPAPANRALDGLQSLLERRFSDTRRRRAGGKVHLVRYADDFIVTGTSRVLLQTEVRPLVEHFLRKRGLELSHEQTTITHLDDGFDFPGQTVRRFANGKVLIKPSKRSVKTFLSKIQETLDNSGGKTVRELILRLNQHLNGWTMYHRYAASERIFHAVDDRIFRKLWRWCRRRHPEKGGKWNRRRYFQRDGDRDWIFTGLIRDSTGAVRADPADGSGRGEGPAVGEDPECGQPLRSGVRALPGGAVMPEADPYAGGSRPDRVSLEGTRGSMCDVRAVASGGGTALAHPPSGRAQSRW